MSRSCLCAFVTFNKKITYLLTYLTLPNATSLTILLTMSNVASTKSYVASTMLPVASTLLLMWTGLYGANAPTAAISDIYSGH